MTRAGTVVAGFLGVLALTATSAAADDSPHLSQAGNPQFPSRSYVLSLPQGEQVPANRIHVRENGKPVPGASIIPAAEAASHGFGVVLVIDTSRSMHGRPIADAMAAARAFARRRKPNQQLGVVTFNAAPTVALPLTTDTRKIQRVLAKPPELGRSTHIFDAVAAAARMLGDAHLKPASVVLLSDGSDTGSVAPSAQVRAYAQHAGVRVFSVGLRSRAFDPSTLGGLAGATGGAYRQANSPNELARIYDQLGSRLANEYLVLYRSPAGPRQRVHVSVSVDGRPGSATTQYVTPALHIASAPYRTADFWGSGGALFLVSLSCGLLLVATFYFAFSRPGGRNLRRRVAQFVTDEPVQSDLVPEAAAVSQPVLAGFGRAFESMSWWPAFEEEVDVAQLDVPPTQIAGTAAAATVLMLALLGLAGGTLVACVALLIPVGVRWFVNFKAERQRRLFADQLADNLQVISSALRAGHSLVSAMAVAVMDAPEPTKREFDRVVADEKLGVPLEEGLAVVARRMQNRDLEQVTLVAALQRDTGGNTAEVLDRVADTVRERADLRRLVRTLTAQGRMSRWVVTALPVALALVIGAMQPSYLDPLLHTGAGHLMIGLSVTALVIGSLAIKKIVDIKV